MTIEAATSMGSIISFSKVNSHGKTTAIVKKISHLIKSGTYKPEEILCLTFSNEAASSMASKLAKELSELETEPPQVSTFHALCADIIRENADKIGLKKEFRIMIPEDAMISLHKNLRVNARLCAEYIYAIGTAKSWDIVKSSAKYSADAETKKRLKKK
jgi:DNA helicase-2/ATP-dependent DNA helicase PcrA